MGDGLTRMDEDTLLGNHWLNDNLVNGGQALIRAMHSSVWGFQDVSVGLILAYDIITGPFVRMLHTGRGHWIVTSHQGSDDTDGESCEIDIYDSMLPSITGAIMKQIAAIVVTKKDNNLKVWYTCILILPHAYFIQ